MKLSDFEKAIRIRNCLLEYQDFMEAVYELGVRE